MWPLELRPKTPAMRLLKSKDLREPYASATISSPLSHLRRRSVTHLCWEQAVCCLLLASAVTVANYRDSTAKTGGIDGGIKFL
jgi:hypothetical protein